MRPIDILNKMNHYLKITAFFLIAIFISSCKTTEYITKVETKVDTIKIERLTVDTLFIDRKIEVTKEVKSNAFLPCPDDKQKPTSGGTNSGDSSAKWEYDEEKGGYNVELYCAEQISIKDSIVKSLHKESDTYKTKYRDTRDNTLKVRKTGDCWKLAFAVVLILWILNITPINLIKRFF